jgi:hypothetical protein
VRQLQSDIATIQSESTVTFAQLAALREDFIALASSGLYPDRQALATFENDLLTAVAASRTAGSGGTLSATETGTLQAELGTAFGSSVSSSTELSQLYNDMLAMAQDSNVTTANITTITSDQARIQADLSSSSSSSTSSTSTSTGCEGGGGSGAAEDLATATVASLLIPGFSETGHFYG